jgi:leucyl-tRNA synthetase
MSKARGNVITPDSVVEKFGADALRVYEMFMAPFDQDIAWSTEGIYGARRFLNRVWGLFGEAYWAGSTDTGEDAELEHHLHLTIHRVSQRLEEFRFNTLVSALMEFVNSLSERQQSGAWRTATFHQSLDTLLLLLAPLAPHISEELWQVTGHTGSVHQQAWPTWDAHLAREQLVQLAVQVNGKLREVIEVPQDAGQAEVEEQALSLPRVQQYLKGYQLVKVVYVPGKVLNVVVRK